MKKPFLLSLIMTLVVSSAFLIPIYYQYEVTQIENNSNYRRAIEEKTNLVARMVDECDENFYRVDNYLFSSSEMYVIKSFDNLDSLVKIINETYDNSFIEQIKIWLNNDESRIGSEYFYENDRPYFFTFNVNKEEEIAVFSASEIEYVNHANERNLRISLILTFFIVLFTFGLNFGALYWFKSKSK